MLNAIGVVTKRSHFDSWAEVFGADGAFSCVLEASPEKGVHVVTCQHTEPALEFYASSVEFDNTADKNFTCVALLSDGKLTRFTFKGRKYIPNDDITQWQLKRRSR
jgi:hypothetical protein